MANEECSKQAKRRTKKEKAAIKATLMNSCVKDINIKEQEEKNAEKNQKKKEKKNQRKKAKMGNAAEHEDSNNVIGNNNPPNDLSEEVTNPSHGKQQTSIPRGTTTCSGLSVGSRTKLEVKLNAMGQLIGGNSEQLSSFVGCLTRELVPLNYEDWRKIHAVQKECYWQAVLQKFTFNGRKTEAKSYILGEMGRLARANKAKYGKNILKKPKHIDPTEWDVFVKSRTSKKFKAKSKIIKNMKEKQTLHYRGSRKGFVRIEDEVYQKEGPISQDKVRLRTWIRGYEKHGEAVKDDEIIKTAKEMLASPSDSSQVNTSYDEDALSKLLKKCDRYSRVTAKGAGACRTKLNAINMTSSKVVELEGNVSILQGEVKDLRSLIEQQAKYINALLKGKGLDVEEHNDKEDSDEDDGYSDEDDNDEDSDDKDNDGTDPKLPTNTSTTPQSQNGSICHKSKKCKLLNWTTREVVAIGSWVSDEPDTIMHFVPLGKNASKVWVDKVIQRDAPLFRPNSSMETVGEAIGATIAWPTDHIMMLDN